MNLQLVLGTEAKGIDTADAPITTQAAVSTLKPGSHLFLLDGKKVGTTDVADYERVQIVVGVKGASDIPGAKPIMMSVPIERRSVLSVNREAHTISRVQIVEVEFSSIASNAEGEAMIVLNDNSYNRTIQNSKIRISVYKKATETLASVLQKIVDKINSPVAIAPYNSSFATATLSGTKIVITMKDPHTDFSMSMDGLFSGLAPVTTQTAKISLTDSKDILASEKEYNANLGDGGYATYSDAYWSFPQQTDLATEYDVFQIKFQGNHDLPQNRVRSAVMWLKVAVPTSLADGFAADMDILFGNAYSGTTGQMVPSKDEEIETDGTDTPGV